MNKKVRRLTGVTCALACATAVLLGVRPVSAAAGGLLTESDVLHYVRDAGIDNARLMINFVIAKGQPRNIDQAAPACAVAAGLL